MTTPVENKGLLRLHTSSEHILARKTSAVSIRVLDDGDEDPTPTQVPVALSRADSLPLQEDAFQQTIQVAIARWPGLALFFSGGS
jgi:hypothetical protein